jgi:MFS family permease
MLGVGGVIGLVIMSATEDRFVHRDLVFGLATTTTGIGLAAASLVTTVPGAAAWMAVMGFGAGAAYLMGLTHLHEYVDDEMRGRIFATLFALMRIGLFVAMAVAVPLVDFFRNVKIGRLDDPTRVVLFLGGITIMLAGLGVLWAMRSLLRSPTLGREAQAIINAANRARRSGMPARAKEEKPVRAKEEKDDS